jgi:carbohydrate-selective porin OprB
VVYSDILSPFYGDFIKHDSFGVGLANGESSSDYKQINNSTSSEWVFELFYKWELPRGITITPDYQYINHPGLSQSIPDAKVLTLRLENNF